MYIDIGKVTQLESAAVKNFQSLSLSLFQRRAGLHGSIQLNDTWTDKLFKIFGRKPRTESLRSSQLQEIDQPSKPESQDVALVVDSDSVVIQIPLLEDSIVPTPKLGWLALPLEIKVRKNLD